MGIRSNDYGKVIFEQGKEGKNSSYVIGFSKREPKFINDLDKEYWHAEWNKKLENSEVEYTEGPKHFEISSRKFWDNSEIEKKVSQVEGLLKEYSTLIDKYESKTALAREKAGHDMSMIFNPLRD